RERPGGACPCRLHPHHVDPCGIGCSRLLRFRSRPATTCVLLPAAIVPKTASLHLLLVPRARSLYSLALVHPFFLASSGEAAVGSFLTERMRLSLPPHPQLSVIPPHQPAPRATQSYALGFLSQGF